MGAHRKPRLGFMHPLVLSKLLWWTILGYFKKKNNVTSLEGHPLLWHYVFMWKPVDSFLKTGYLLRAFNPKKLNYSLGIRINPWGRSMPPSRFDRHRLAAQHQHRRTEGFWCPPKLLFIVTVESAQAFQLWKLKRLHLAVFKGTDFSQECSNWNILLNNLDVWPAIFSKNSNWNI